MTPQEVINDVRELVNDTTVTYRHSDAQLLIFVNQSIKRTALLRPDLFSVYDDMVCAVSTVVQTAPADCFRLMEVLQVVGGDALYESDRPTLDMHTPGWRAATPAAARTWMREPRSARGFFIYPAAPATAQSLTIQYAKLPVTDYAIGDTITELHETYKASLVDCTIFLAQSIDDEHISDGRAKLFFDSFLQGLGMAAKSRQVTDTEGAAVQEKPNSGEI